MSLTEYTRKRNFKKTAEPKAVLGNKTAHRFVIQKHAASRLHYDFRLEINGVLKSWAVPKGLPFTKGEKRLAVQVEDHPVSYINFEGTIPKGQYGGGTVMIWDKGVYAASVESPLKELDKGKLHFSLSGKKLHGEWYLVQLRGSTQWLMIKGGDDLKPISKKMDDTSALSGKTMAQLSNSGTVWQSSPRDSASSKQNSFKGRFQTNTATPKSLAVKFIPPMKAKLVKLPPPGDGHEVEIKFDGYWARAFKNGGVVQLLSKNENDFSQKFAQIVEAVRELKIGQAEIDGEIVALNEKGISKFQLLQAYELGEKRPPLFFYAFDLLRLNGKDITRLPLHERKEELKKILGNKSGLIRYSASLGDDAKRLLKLAEKTGLEGLICKRKDSLYEAGERSGAWVKLKLHTEQEFVIGGYTNPEGTRHHFGALLLGFYKDKKLWFCGKVGTGFDEKLLKSLNAQFQPIVQQECPFSNLPELRSGRFSAGVTAAEMKRCHWVKPQMVCQIQFAEWTRDEKLRQPVFLGLREDKNPTEVVREKAV